MLKRLLILVVASMLGNLCFAQKHSSDIGFRKFLYQEDADGHLHLNSAIVNSENPRLIAIALDISLGLLGVHRLYLGTDLKVPIAYTLTFGGGGILWIVDLLLLIFSKDIKPFVNNPHVFMWIRN